jgi:putative hydrolase of the HAD superfamily
LEDSFFEVTIFTLMKNRASITTILFDFGDVLVIDTSHFVKKFFGEKSLTNADRKILSKAVEQADLGKISTRQLAAIIKEVFKLPYSIVEIQSLYSRTVLVKPVWEIFKKLSKEYKVGILSNNQKNLPEKAAKYVGISLKGIFFFNSANYHVIKPNKLFYTTALKKLKLKPQECIFIDDKPENVKGAEAIKMHALLFDGNIKKLIAGLKKYGVEVKL